MSYQEVTTKELDEFFYQSWLEELDELNESLLQEALIEYDEWCRCRED